MNTKLEQKLVSLGAAERYLATERPSFALSRHQLRRLCMHHTVPCTALPHGANRTRYMVRVHDLVCFLRAKERDQFGRYLA